MKRRGRAHHQRRPASWDSIGNKGQANYAACKAGLIGFTKSMAKEYASRGMLVNCLAPGFIETDMTAALPEAAKATLLEGIALGRLGRPMTSPGPCSFSPPTWQGT